MKTRDNGAFAVLLLTVGPNGALVPKESFERISERACEKHARFLHATNPTGRCEIHYRAPDSTTWGKIRDLPRSFAPGERIHAVHVEIGAWVTDTLYIFEAVRAGDVIQDCPHPDLAVLVCRYVMPPLPGRMRGVERKVQPGDVVTSHWTFDFINVGSAQRAVALFNEATIAWQTSKTAPKEARLSPVLTALMAMTAVMPPPK